MTQETTRIEELKKAIQGNEALLHKWRTDMGKMTPGEEMRKTFIMCLSMENTTDSDKEELKALEAQK